MITFDSGANAPTFDHPLEMLLACHGKILRQCDTLRKLSAHLKTHGCDEQVRQAAYGILRYFDTAGQLHHRDEEENLFPALWASAGNDPERLDALLQRLLQEHVAMLSAWDELRPALLQLSEGMNTRVDDRLTERFINAYTGHIATENSELLPLAERLLTPDQLQQIGACMAARRGVGMQGSA